jgi:hypothetical protein
LKVGEPLCDSRKISDPRMSTLVTSSSRVTNFVHVTFGSLTFAAGASHIASSFCTPLIDSAAARGDKGQRFYGASGAHGNCRLCRLTNIAGNVKQYASANRIRRKQACSG